MANSKISALNSKERTGVALYYALQLFFNLLLWVPIFYEFQRQIGLSDPEIFRIQSVYYLVFCFFEIPTGWLADRYGYRLCLVLGAVTLALANLLPIAAPTYAGMMTHFLGIALARSLLSGASSAYLYEWLQARGLTSHYKRIEGDARFWSLVARVACWSIVGYLMAQNIFLPYWLSAANALLALLAALLLPRLSIGKTPASQPKAASSSFHLAWQTVRKRPVIVVLMMQGIGIFVMVRVLQVNLYQPILKDKALGVETFGWIMAAMTVCEAIGSKLTPLVRGRIHDSLAVCGASLVLSLSLAAIALGNAEATLVSFGVFSLAAGLAFPVQKQLMNDAITAGHARATLLSIESILDRAVCALAVLPLGGLVGEGRINETLMVCAIATTAASIAIQALAARLGDRHHAKVDVPSHTF